MKGYFDLHSHFLYGMDDGAEDRQMMEDMLDAASADGISFLAATVHCTPGITPFDEENYLGRLQEARDYCARMEKPITVFSGAEILYTPALEQYIQEHPLPVYQGSKCVLLEFVPDISFSEADNALDLLESCGYEVFLAHIERYKCFFFGGAEKLKKKHDVRYQMNCSSVLGGRGFLADRHCRKWLRSGLIDAVSSDAHSTGHRRFRMKQAYDALAELVGRDTADRLTHSNLIADLSI